MSARADLLIRLVREHGWTRGVELGVFKGDTFFALLDACPQLEWLGGVDVWCSGHRDLEPPTDKRRTEADDGYRSYADEDMRKIARQVMARRENYRTRGFLFEMETQLAASFSPPGWLDFVFIDADHTEAGVRRDIEHWRPKLKPGGWLIGHDISFPSVRRAVDALCPGWRALEADCWAMPV